MSFRGRKRVNTNSCYSNPATSTKNFNPVEDKRRRVNYNVKKNFVYILKLQDDFWYVGTTTDPTSRLLAHGSRDGAEWTRQHPPVEGFSSQLKEVKGDEGQAKLEEDAEVKRLMKEYGIDKVRGGSYSSISLSRTDVKSLTKELRHASGGCIRCGHESHWAKSCYAKKDVVGNPISDDENECRDKSSYSKKNNARDTKDLPTKVKSFSRGPKNASVNHKNVDKSTYVKKKIAKDTKELPSKVKTFNQGTKNDNADTCYRCGRNTHWAKNCYAKMDVDGHPLN